ncbi:hypothetical protein OIO90_005912 [Microbotryomycetes sp. JL221]|nr:hypothetical protein OIO90_005912 [Microbotryomycetes sp. JL221]
MTDFSAVRADVQRQMPLRNLHWVRRTGANRTIRTIQALNVEVKPSDSFGPVVTSLPLLERPYAYLLFVVCDTVYRHTLGDLDKDNDVYRAAIRPQIKDWLDTVSQRPHHEWLIVHVTKSRNAGAKFYQRKGTVIDKIKADFNTNKRDRCIQVAQAASEDDPTAWAEFQNKLKEAIVATFDSNVSLYEEDIRRADSQRQLEGWQYLPFFRQKEALADSFEAMTLVEEALVQYDELEALFFQALKEREHAGLHALGGLSTGDDSSPLLSLNKKPYRRLISADQITVFDFRVYLFARQAALLFMLGRVADVARRGGFFISTFARTLKQHTTTLGKNFLESWTYSACLNIVDECQKRVDSRVIDRITTQRFTAAKAELLELARKQLDKIGIEAGHLPTSHPFSMSLNEGTQLVDDHRQIEGGHKSITQPELAAAINQVVGFDKLYLDITNRCIQAYQASGRRRCSLKLHASLAALEKCLPAHYVDLRWVQIEAILLQQSTSLQKRLGLPREQLLSTLALVRAGMELNSPSWSLGILRSQSDGTEANTASELMRDVHSLSQSLSKGAFLRLLWSMVHAHLVIRADFAAIAFPTFTVALADVRGRAALSEDGVMVDITVTSLLPCVSSGFEVSDSMSDIYIRQDLEVNEIRLKFATVEGEQVWFTASVTKIRQGRNPITVFSPTSVTGRLALELSQIRFSRIIFQYSHRPISARNLAPDPRHLPITLRQPMVFFERDFQAVDLSVEPAQRSKARSRSSLPTIVGEDRHTIRMQDLEYYTSRSRAVPERALSSAHTGSVANAALADGVAFAERFIHVSDQATADERISSSPIFIDLLHKIKLRIKGIVDHVLRKLDMMEHVRWFTQALTSEVISAIDVLEYSVAGRFRNLKLDTELWQSELQNAFGSQASAALTATEQIFETLRASSSATPASAWRQLVIPVEIPHLSVLTHVRASAATDKLELGRPMAMFYSVRMTTSWSADADAKSESIEFKFNVTARLEDWLVSGCKRGTFQLRPDAEHEVKLTLVPLRPGTLFLPGLQLSPTNNAVTHETQAMNGASYSAAHNELPLTLDDEDAAAQPDRLQAGSGPLDGRQPSGARSRRSNTLTSRMFGDEWQILSTPPATNNGHNVLGRARASSRASSSGAPVDIVVVPPAPGSASADPEGTIDNDGAEQPHQQRRRRFSSLSRRDRQQSESSNAQEAAQNPEAMLHHEQEVQLLDVLDQSVSTTAHLANIQSAFWPASLTRRPVVELEAAPADEEIGAKVAVEAPQGYSDEELLVHIDNEDDPLDTHLVTLLRKQQRSQKRKEMFRQTMRGVWAFLKTPLGVFAAIYMLLVIVAGAALVLLLIIPMGSYARKLWVEICSQILTGLFTITSLLPLPWRLYDWYNIGTITYFAHATRKRRQRLHLPPLRDPNDLPEAPDAEFWVGPGGEKMVGPRPKATMIPLKAKKTKQNQPPPKDALDCAEAVELGAMTGLAQVESDLSEEEPVLSDSELDRLRKAQMAYSKSQTYYRAHTTPTHHATPIKWAFIVALLLGQLDASIMIWQAGERTKRKAEVTRKMWLLLKKDEEELEARRKAIIEKRHAEKEAHKHGHRHS